MIIMIIMIIIIIMGGKKNKTKNYVLMTKLFPILIVKPDKSIKNIILIYFVLYICWYVMFPFCKLDLRKCKRSKN